MTLTLELNCCSGGMALGFRRAGIEFTWSIDWDADACASYERNIGHRPLQVDIREVVRMVQTGWLPRERFDLVVADPPCTPWSRSGKREGLSDDRDLLADTVELLLALKPRAWLIGNVPGLDDGPNVGAVQKTIGRLARDYCIDYARLDAAAYGVPQHRVRPFWFGHAHDAPHIRWPMPTHGPARSLALAGCELHPFVTVRQALSDLAPDELGSPIRVRASRRHHQPSQPSQPSRTVTRNTHSDGALLANDRHPINRPDEPSYTVTTKGDGRGAQGACVVEWPWNRPATTVQADDRLAPPGHHGQSFLSAPATTVTCRDEIARPGRNGRDGTSQSTNAIKLSLRAALRLQSFPDGWHIAGATKKAQWGQVGMAMPPGLAEPVARAVAEWLAQQARAA